MSAAKEGIKRIRERGHFWASDTFKPGVAAFDGYAIARREGLARRTNLRIDWQPAELGVGELKAHSSTISDRIPIQQNIARLKHRGVTHA